MELAFDSHLLSRILFTITALGYGLVTIKADFNKTHATNPNWTPHARYHVVWQVLSYAGIALIALWLTWFRGPDEAGRLYIAGALGLAVYLGFFGAAVARPVFGGKFYDENGYPPFPAPVGGGRWDVNVTAFSGLLTLHVVAILAI